MLCGLLNIDKPRGETSRWVVDRVKRLVQPAKVGHAGTLDPLATGVLLVCIGSATRLVDYIHQHPKRYRAEFLLGRTSPTEDIDGEVAELAGAPIPTRADVETAARRFTGEILQRPPAYSAVKVRGRRSYDLARKGHEVELAVRPVTVNRLDVIDFAYPRLTLDVQCSTGTYIRSLGRDLAEALGTGAVMSALERTAIGGIRIEDAISVSRLTRENLAAHLLLPNRAVEHLPGIVLSPAEIEHVAHGRSITCPPASHATIESREYAAFDDRGSLVAIVRRRDDGTLAIDCNFVGV
jgi:tRNA pseudouridine55 synthase